MINLAYSQGIINDGSLWVIGSGAKWCTVGGSNGNCLLKSNGSNHARIDLDGSLEFQGNLTNSISTGSILVNREAIGSGDGTIVFNGTTNQIVNGSSKTIFEKLQINNAANVNFDINSDIEKDIVFSSGKIIMNGSYLITVLNTATNAISGYDNTKYIVGDLQRMLSTGSYDFCIGTSNYYELVNTNITSLGSATYVKAEFTQGSAGAVPVDLEVDGTYITDFLNYGYWTLSADNETGLVFDISTTSRGHSNGGSDVFQHALFRKIGAGDWSNFGTHNNSSQTGILSNPITAKRTGSTNLGSFVIGKSQFDPLFVKLVDLNYNCMGNMVEFTWATASESNSDYFCLKSSPNLINWIVMKNIPATGNSGCLIQYKTSVPNDFYNYVKLEEYSLDGKKRELVIKYVSCSLNDESKIAIYPNPVTDELFVELPTIERSIIINIYDVCGKNIYNETVHDEETININTSSFLNGAYAISVITDSGKYDSIFFKQ